MYGGSGYRLETKARFDCVNCSCRNKNVTKKLCIAGF